MMVVIFIGALLIVFAIILVLPFRLEITYRKELKNDLLQIGMGISHFSLFKLRIPSLKLHQKMVDRSLEFPAQLQVGRDITLWERHFILGRPLELLADIGRFFSGKVGRILINNYPDLIKISRQFLKNVTCHRLEWATQIGSGDASLTGYSAGLLWWIKFSLYRLLSRNFQLAFSRPSFQVIPDFEKKRLDLEFNCIFEVPIGHIIIAGSKTLWTILRFLVRG